MTSMPADPWNVPAARSVQGTMTRMAALRGARLLILIAAVVALLAVLFVWDRASDPRSQVVPHASAKNGWKTIQYEGVRVDIPTTWERLDMGGCEFSFEQWAPPDAPTCGQGGGVAFYASATFDPAHGPGLRRAGTNGTDASDWAGYVYAGDFAVYASDDDRDLVHALLDSARAVRQ
jgi:hypothetical protein